MQKWKKDPTLHSCETIKDDLQAKKVLDYYSVYKDEFLEKDPIRDWESIERCKELWFFALKRLNVVYNDIKDWNVLDCGTKDGQFPEFLSSIVNVSLGTEISEEYVKYAQSKNRPVVHGDVCALPDEWTGHFDVVFSHHLLGLTPDYWLALSEMYRTVKPGGYMITLNDVPGNPRKHYSYIDSPKIFYEFTRQNQCAMLINGRWSTERPGEWVYFIQKCKEESNESN